MAKPDNRSRLMPSFDLDASLPTKAADAVLAKALEAELMSDLHALAAALGRSGGGGKDRLPHDKPAHEDGGPSAMEAETTRLGQQHRPQFGARPPRGRSDAEPLESRLAEAHGRGAGESPKAALPTAGVLPLRRPQRGAAPGAPSTKSKGRGGHRPDLAKPTPCDEARLSEALEPALRGWSIDAANAAAAAKNDRRPLVRPRRGLIAAAFLVAAIGGAGATVAYQTAGPRLTAPAGSNPNAASNADASAPAKAGPDKGVRVVGTRSFSAAGVPLSSPPGDGKLAGATTTATANTAIRSGSPARRVGDATADVEVIAVDVPANETATPTSAIRDAAPPRGILSAAPAPAQKTSAGPVGQRTPINAAPPSVKSATGAVEATASIAGAAVIDRQNNPNVFTFAQADNSGSSKSMVAKSDVNVRSGPDNKYDTIAILKAGTPVPAADCKLWCPVTVDGKNGFVFHSFLSPGDGAR